MLSRLLTSDVINAAEYFSYKYSVIKIANEKIKQLNYQPQQVGISTADELNESFRSYYNQPDIFIHYSDLPTLGLNPNYKYNTPFGLYGYLFNDTLLTKAAPFAKDRKYFHIFRVSGKGLDVYAYTNDDLMDDYDLITHTFKGKENKKIIDRAFNTAMFKIPAGVIWNITRLLARGNPFTWTKILTNVLGYTYILDFGHGVIHTSEPAQAVCLYNSETSNKFQLLKTFQNNTSTKYEFNNNLGERAVSILVNRGVKSIQELTDLDDSKVRLAIVNLARQGNEIAIKKLDNYYDDMFVVILELAKQRNPLIINQLDIHYPSMRTAIIEFARKGYPEAIKKLNACYPETRDLIIELANQGNQDAIQIAKMYDLL